MKLKGIQRYGDTPTVVEVSFRDWLGVMRHEPVGWLRCKRGWHTVEAERPYGWECIRCGHIREA